MKRLHILSMLFIVLITLLAISVRAISEPVGHITVLEKPEVVAQKIDTQSVVTITGIVTGWVEAPAFILMDQEDPRTPEEYRKARWVPSVAYIVAHPSQGKVILDFGLKGGTCDYGLKPVYWVPCQNEGYDSLAEYLRKNAAIVRDIRYLIPSHMHGDHVSGLSDVSKLTDVPILMTDGTLEGLYSHMRVLAGVPSEMLQDDMEVILMNQSYSSDAILGQFFDVFGDGSLKIFETGGHMDGHISALATVEKGNVLLTFDAAHLKANFELQIPSGSVSDKQSARESLKRLGRIVDQIGDVQMKFGHDPSQWECVKSTIAIDAVSPLGCEN